jgi:hypothetical protein
MIMLPVLFKKEKIILLLTWSFFSFSAIKCLSIFIYVFGTGYFFIVAGFYSLLLFAYYFVFKSQFGIRLNYVQYIITNVLSGIVVTFFSYGYYLLIMLNNDYYNFRFYFALVISNIILGSLLFLLTRIKKQ